MERVSKSSVGSGCQRVRRQKKRKRRSSPAQSQSVNRKPETGALSTNSCPRKGESIRSNFTITIDHLLDSDGDEDDVGMLEEQEGYPSANANESGVRYPPFLMEAYKEMCEKVEISQFEYEAKRAAVANLQDVFAQFIPQCKLYMFRHYFLGLRSLSKSELVIFMDYKDVITQGGNWDAWTSSQRMKIHVAESQTACTAEEIVELMGNPDIKIVRTPDRPRGSELHGHHFVLDNKFRFTIIPDARFLTEVQNCRLMGYMCGFDPKTKPLLGLVTYWAKRNNVMFLCRRTDPYQSYSVPPEGTGLLWMVMVFLCNKKIVKKTPRQIQSCLHSDLMIVKNIDIGFADDDAKSCGQEEKMSEKFIMELIRLAQEFFEFYARLSEGKWIINCLDGEVVQVQSFRLKHVYHSTSLSYYEAKRLCRGLPTKRKSIHMIQPLRYTMCFPLKSLFFRKYNAPMMGYTAEKLGDFLTMVDGGSAYEKVDFSTLLTMNSVKLERVLNVFISKEVAKEKANGKGKGKEKRKWQRKKEMAKEKRNGKEKRKRQRKPKSQV